MMARVPATCEMRDGLKANDCTETDIDYEHHKKESLQKQKKGEPEWKRELASDSEEAVYAERNHGHETIETMQKRTKEKAEESKN